MWQRREGGWRRSRAARGGLQGATIESRLEVVERRRRRKVEE
jgi:hypothetical protein